MEKFVALLLLAVLAACSSRPAEVSLTVAPDLKQVTPDQWQRLSQRAIYFGHQSVGENILDGIGDLASTNPQIQLRIVSNKDTSPAPALREFHVGQNGNPDSKNADFIAATQRPLGPQPVLMFKYCYVDTDEKTDAKVLFDRYQETVAAIRGKHPEAVIVHFTLPLVAESSRLRYYINAVRGIPTTRDENAKRNEYNDLLRTTYEGKEPIFDLAAVESTRADGTQEHVMVNGKPVPALAPEWTDDGGHLNVAGRRRAAEHLLVTLATLPTRHGRVTEAPR